MRDKESYFISQFSNKHIGDDGAVIDNYVYSKDLFFANVHFKRSWMSLYDIAYKSMLINISDAIVMNAKPKYALLGIQIPSNFSKSKLKELSNGFLDAAKAYDFEIIGGDTIGGELLNISITLISHSDHPIYRNSVQIGDMVAFTGDLGSVKRDLEKLFAGEQISKQSKFIKPKLHGNFFYEAAPFIHSALDISDGLSKELSRLSQINKISFAFNRNFGKDILCSGEEYEILFTFAPHNFDILQKLAQKHSVPFTQFATVTKGSYLNTCPENHF